jgi:hypothetical protein
MEEQGLKAKYVKGGGMWKTQKGLLPLDFK